VSSSVAVDANSEADVASLAANTSYAKLGSDPTQYTFPVYDVTSATATVPVFIAGAWSNVTSSTSLSRVSGGEEVQVPVPALAQAASGSDGQIIVIDPATGDEWGFWQFYNSSDPLSSAAGAGQGTAAAPLAVGNAQADFSAGQQIVIGQGSSDAETATIASFPDANHIVLSAPTVRAHGAGETVWAMGASNGYHYNTNWNGVPPGGFGSRGAGVPYLAGLIRPCEIAQGHIDHALAFAYQNTTAQFVYPATKSDGGAASGMPEGAHLQLDPSISDTTIQSWGCTGACFTIAKALQKYGMYLIDTAGHPKLYAEDTSTANWGTTLTASTPNPIPLTAFRVIDG
jgi:hypothetical protein